MRHDLCRRSISRRCRALLVYDLLSVRLNPRLLVIFFAYFSAMTEDRRKSPGDDVASVIANATVDGKQIGDLEAMSYYIIIH